MDCAKITDTLLARIAELEDKAAKAYASGYQDGGEYVLVYMSDLYEGVEETDVWADFHEGAN